MKKVLLLRSYGDFVIALYHLPPNLADHTIQLVASKHLVSLHQALMPYLSEVQQKITFIDVGIKNQLLSGFTDRYFFSVQNLKELGLLHRQLKQMDASIFLLEQQRKAWLIKLTSKGTFDVVHSNGNVYDSWADFYQHTTITTAVADSYKKLLIFPDSRLARKEITNNVLQQLADKFGNKGYSISRAYFKQAKSAGAMSYQSFEELVSLIDAADFIISSDSLPAHIAQLMQKPHAVLYAKEINQEWVTPFARENNLAFRFSEINQLEI